jgi:Kdo2-lipid IVA lauroyltransferase/acyltransferase
LKSILSNIATHAGIAVLKLVSRLPLPLLYGVAGGMYFIVYNLIRYRRKVVRGNLRNSFPEKTERELIILERKYYRNLCDLVVESVRTPALTPEEISRRMVFRNPGVINAFREQGRSVLVLAMHYGNWEWLLHMPLVIKHHPFFVYKPLQNEVFDKYLNHVRERFGGETISMSLTLRKLLDAEREKKPVLTWLAADQTPPWNHPFWTIFLNQATQFFNGPAKLARRFNQPVFFQHIRRIKRGYYETWFELLTENPAGLSEEEITLAYVKKAEQVIREYPENYLWSHRRWKNSKHAPGNLIIPT